MQAAIIETLCARLPIHYQFDLGLCERRQDVVWFLELSDAWMSATRTAFALGAAIPMKVRIDGPNHRVAAGFLQARLAHSQHCVFQIGLCGGFRMQPFEGVEIP